MSKEKPGIFRRFFSLLGGLVKVLRWGFNLIFLVLIGLFLYSLLGQEVKPLPDRAALHLVPSGVLVEERSYTDPLTQLMQQNTPYDAETPVADITDALKNARDDKRITGVVLDLNYLEGGGITKLAAVGSALETFRKSGKPVIAVADTYTQERYYLASFADEIQLNPMGGVLITGFGAYGSYFKRAADKLKINFHIFRAGQFKSAVEPFTRSDMSENAKANALSWLSELWQKYTGDVESNRKLATGAIDEYVATLPSRLGASQGDFAALAADYGLVDKVRSRPDTNTELMARFGADEGSYRKVYHKVYLTHTRLPRLPDDSADNIGLIVASGTILDGEQMEGNIGGNSLSKLLRQALQDDSLKALVLRIDSPGGSAFASDLIRQELLNVKARMPVVVSMGSVAASGGYWISAQADEIWAAPTTITGSIGVFGIVPTFEDSLDAIGVNSDGVGTTTLADAYHLDRPLSPEMSQVIELGVANIYDKFISLVAEGRDRPASEIREVAGGRIWTGSQAKDIGLVDSLGGVDDAIASAARRAGLESWSVKTISRPLTFQEQILRRLSAEGAALISLLVPLPETLSGFRHVVSSLNTLKFLNDPAGIYLQCFSCPE